ARGATNPAHRLDEYIDDYRRGMLDACAQHVSSRSRLPTRSAGPKPNGSQTSVGPKRRLSTKARPGAWLCAKRTMSSCASPEGSRARRIRCPTRIVSGSAIEGYAPRRRAHKLGIDGVRPP